MSFVISKASPAAALATNGTLVFAYPANPIANNPIYQYPFDLLHQSANPPPPQSLEQTSAGDFASSNQHIAWSAGLQQKLIFGKDFSLSFSNTIASGITMTYLGASTIPAGTQISLQLELVGQNDGAPFKDDARIARGALCPVGVLRFGTPLAASTTVVLATTAVLVATVVPLATPVVLDIPRNLQYVSSSAGDTTQTITARGFDEFGVAMTETSGVLTGVTPVLGKKAFKTVVSLQASVALAGNLSVGSGVLMGMPAAVETIAYVIGENMDNTKPTAGTFLKADNTVPSATTGDVRGTYSANAAPNAAHAYEVILLMPDPMYMGLAQFAG